MGGIISFGTFLVLFFDLLLWRYSGVNLFLQSTLFFIVPAWTLYLIGTALFAPWVFGGMTKEQHKVLMDLTAMTNRDLEDIGITRSDIRAVALGTYNKESFNG